MAAVIGGGTTLKRPHYRGLREGRLVYTKKLLHKEIWRELNIVLHGGYI